MPFLEHCDEHCDARIDVGALPNGGLVACKPRQLAQTLDLIGEFGQPSLGLRRPPFCSLERLRVLCVRRRGGVHVKRCSDAV